MRAPLIALVVLASLITIAPGPAESSHGPSHCNPNHTYAVRYVAKPNGIPPRVFGSNYGFDPGLGGSGFPCHGHATTATITITDDINGPIDGAACQNMNNNFICDNLAGEPDTYQCIDDGVKLGFPVAASAFQGDKLLSVHVSPYFSSVELCPGRVAEATTGWITLTYDS